MRDEEEKKATSQLDFSFDYTNLDDRYTNVCTEHALIQCDTLTREQLKREKKGNEVRGVWFFFITRWVQQEHHAY